MPLRSRRTWLGRAFAIPFVSLAGGCSGTAGGPRRRLPVRDIQAVLADHDRELMAMPGVVGVYVGLLERSGEPCLRVMLERGDRALRRSIPRMLEGYPVDIEVSGPLRPMR